MVEKRASDEALVFQASDDAYYAIPWNVVEQGRLPATETPDLGAGAEDVKGFGQRALLPYIEDGSYFALGIETISRYRLPEAQSAKVGELLGSEVVGYGNAFGHDKHGPGGAGFGDVTIINQYNINVGINLAFNSPGAVMGINQLGLNTFS